jgi:thiol-disulfide isomerase/thioredoxin
MKTNTAISLLAVALSLAAVATYTTRAKSDMHTGGPTAEQVATVAAPADTESSARVHLNALTASLEFLGAKPTLAGHPLLIEFWATWCPPCRASIAHLNELDKKYHDRGLEIVGISDEDKSVVESFRARTPMHYAVALDTDQKLANGFQVQTIPQAWLFDKDGRVVWSGHPLELEEQTIARVLPVIP